MRQRPEDGVRFQRFEERYQLRMESGEHVASALIEFLDSQQIGYGTMTGIGAVSGATVSYWNSDTREYEQHQLDDQMEVVSLVGNVSRKDGVPFTHIHVALGRRDLSIVGGHLNDAVVHPNLEVWLRAEAQAVDRTLDETCGLYLMNLPERA